MSIKPRNIDDWGLGQNELSYYAPSEGASNESSLRLYIPKIIPLIPFDVPRQVVATISKSFLLNADQCKPSIASTVRTQNYLTVERYDNDNFKYPLLSHGAQLIVEVLNNNVDTLRVTNKIDQSYNPVY
jgi:hypothetical protein